MSLQKRLTDTRFDRMTRPADPSESNGQTSWLLTLPRPAPAAGEAAYQEERRLALAGSRRKQGNYLRYQQATRGRSVDYLPIKLDIENVSRCNFRCTMCQVSQWPNQRRAGDMSFEHFKHLIDQQYGLVEIKLQGMGEPTLGGEDYFRMIRYAREQHIWVRTVTNASRLHLRDTYKKLVDAGPNEVQISIDGATKETFEKIRVGSKFEGVAANCKLINDYCREIGVNVTKMWTVVQRDNVGELPDLVGLGHELGFKSMVLSLDLTDWGQEQWNQANRGVTVDSAITPGLVDQLAERSRKLGVELAWWNINTKYTTESAESLCPWPFERAYVASDLRVVPCCQIANPDVAELGRAEDFTATWRGEAYQAFRQAHLDGRIPSVCRNCYDLRDDKSRRDPGEVLAQGVVLQSAGN